MQEEPGSGFESGSDASSVGAEALRLFRGGFKCGEAVLMALARRQGVESDVIPAIATGFGAGMGRTGNMCGAVTGAVMGLGLAHGRADAAGPIEPSYAAVGDLLRRFTSEFGSTNCVELLGCDIATHAGQQEFKDRRLFERCALFTRRSAEIAAELADRRPRRREE